MGASQRAVRRSGCSWLEIDMSQTGQSERAYYQFVRPTIPTDVSRHLRGYSMSVILRIVFVLAGFITALFVARDALHFDLVQSWIAILLVAILLGAGGVWALRRKT